VTNRRTFYIANPGGGIRCTAGLVRLREICEWLQYYNPRSPITKSPRYPNRHFAPEHRGVVPNHTSPPQQIEEFAELCARMTRRYA
jgi:hypothetical protein